MRPHSTPAHSALSGATRIAVLHPGMMGVTVASCAAAAGCTVGWLGQGRSAASRERAESAGLREYASLAECVADVDCLISVCPPAAARATAETIRASGFAKLYLDANAVSPRTAVEIAEIVSRSGADYVDGGLIGPPVAQPGTTRLYLSGARANEAAAYFAGSALEAVDIGLEVSAASALKMSYAAWTKGSVALLIAIAALAERSGVAEVLAAEWARSLPDLRGRLARDASGSARKAWRFVGEMDEIAKTFSEYNLPGDFHRGAGAIYAALAVFRDSTEAPSLERVIATVLAASKKT